MVTLKLTDRYSPKQLFLFCTALVISIEMLTTLCFWLIGYKPAESLPETYSFWEELIYMVVLLPFLMTLIIQSLVLRLFVEIYRGVFKSRDQLIPILFASLLTGFLLAPEPAYILSACLVVGVVNCFYLILDDRRRYPFLYTTALYVVFITFGMLWDKFEQTL